MFSAIRTRVIVAPRFAKAFSTSRAALDISRLTLIGRLGNDPVQRTTASGKPYYTYNVATAPGPPIKDESGALVNPPTSWHTVFAFNELSHPSISRLGKGSTVYVEADLEMRSAEAAADGAPVHDRALLRHRSLSVINRVKPASEVEGEEAE
ncbi:hypothetical protein M231_00084 [Tremella mesenterica]|uniref:Nucleic acid-binding protein n=1 Tax=Tremella mesenterica TaxID=5217 RepID=A0A4Q1BWK5_TREME|nr:hypothetical protein M231_00084 [Tremella mesenterica]